MPSLGNPTQTAVLIEKYHFRFQKKYGQNFLIDRNILEGIIDAADITQDDIVVEIGPGIGTMTQYLCERAREVIAIEIDEKLIPILTETLQDYSNVTVICDDVLKLDLAGLIAAKNVNRPIKVVANLPYYITTPIIMGLFESKVPLTSITIMVQKEVALRMQAGPGTKDYGALSLAVQYYAKPVVVMEVSPSCFVPQPKVASAVIRLDKLEAPSMKVENEALMFQIIRASFNQRRKTLVNGLFNAGFLKLDKEEIAQRLEQMDLDRNIRGESLTLQQFIQLSNLLDASLEK